MAIPAMRKVQIQVSEQQFARLQAIARPLVDDVDAVIERLLDNWETNPPSTTRVTPNEQWTSARGERIRIGTKLRGSYLGKQVEATVDRAGIVFQGKPYASPSKAAIAVKKSLGAKHSASFTNGWRFWEALDEVTNAWVPLDRYR